MFATREYAETLRQDRTRDLSVFESGCAPRFCLHTQHIVQDFTDQKIWLVMDTYERIIAIVFGKVRLSGLPQPPCKLDRYVTVIYLVFDSNSKKK